MKIKTQAQFLIAGIVLTPLLIILVNIVYNSFFTVENASDLSMYEEISLLMDEPISTQDWEAVIRYTARSSRFAETAIFRDDYLVLYSTIPEFKTGNFSSNETVLSLINTGDQSSDYIFTSRNLEEKRVYILNKTKPRLSRPRLPLFFAPALIIFIIIILLIIFAVCMSIFITRTITHSVQVLDDATRRIAEGELDLQVDIKGSNEITSLTNSLNKMRKALKEEELRRSRFIMGITHDLKTPLALIKGYAEAIEDGIAEDSISRIGAAEIIITKADQLEGMINDLINFVRMETGEWREKLKNINVSAYLKNLLSTISHDVELLHHEFCYDINLPENILVPMDERLVQRALENLINNAIRHSSGSIVRFAAIMIENTIRLTISDNGTGIDKEDIPHVFDIFYRGSSSRREQGMGLGLAVVKWVVDYHGWSICASSEKDKGTSFIISININENAKQ